MTKKQAVSFVSTSIFLVAAGLIFFATPVRTAALEAGSVVTSEGSSLYYVGFDEKLHPFPSAAVFHSWFPQVNNVVYIGKGALAEHQIGSSVCIRPGTWLVQFRGFSDVYAVEPGCQLRQLRSRVEAFVLFGANWEQRVVYLDTVERGVYRINGFDDPQSDRDSDADGVSDYEEEVYWLTDPQVSDSDGDGRSDGEEILSESSPSDGDLVGVLRPGMYTFSAGTILPGNTADRFYYQSTNGDILEMNRRTYEGDGKYLGFDRFFLTRPGFTFSLSERSRGSIFSKEHRLYYPTVNQNGNIITL